MNQPSTAMHTNSRRRPGGRTADVTARIQQAIVDLIVEGGVDACTFSAVAQRAGIERSTLYRRYPDRWDAIIDAFMVRAARDVMPDLGESFADDLTSILLKLVEWLESPLGSALLAAAIELRRAHGGAFPRPYFDRRMEQLAPMFEAAIERGELRATVDRETLFASAAGPIYFRIFIAGGSADEDFVRNIVDSICRLYCLPDSAAKLSLSPPIS
jgi:AcrR family transcriptional regulator